jgi:uroporphyrinogen-III synthase
MSENRLRVVSLESRQAPEMVRLLERHGCEALSAPSMREVPLSDQHEAFAFGDQLLAGGCEILLLLTGVGTRMLLEALSTRFERDAVIAAIGGCDLVCRGPKPVAFLKTIGLRPRLVAPEPNTWHDLLPLLDAELPVANRQVTVQAYGRTNQPLLDALRERGARVQSVGIYAWAMPVDTAPLAAAIDAICDDQADVVMFTSAQQLEHLFALATQRGREAELQTALRERVVCASVGPLMSEALEARGIAVDLAPEHPKMGPLVLAIARRAPQLLAAKRARV